MIVGYLGILFAYGLLSGSALQVLFSGAGINLSKEFLALCFMFVSFFVLRYGIKLISRVLTCIHGSSVLTFHMKLLGIELSFTL